MLASRSDISRRSGKVSSHLVAAIALLVGAGMLSGPIDRTRSELQLLAHESSSENLPPDIALAQAGLGTFRALATSVLWTRYTRLQREGQNFEAKRLADWITRLQPRFSAVWSFQAWNMAFNISQATDLPAERWMWIREGIAVLRDRGIRLNPRKIDLYRALSHIFLRKVSGSGDELHLYYQGEFARQWHELLGPPPGDSAREIAEWFRPIAEAARDHVKLQGANNALDRFLTTRPRTRRLLDQIEAIGFEPGTRLLRKVTASDPGELRPWIEQNSSSVEYAQLLAFLRARALVKEYNMDPAWMMKLLEGDWVGNEAGDKIPLGLDWRLPEAHCIYWASLGLDKNRGLLRPEEPASFFCDSNLLSALSLLEENGRLVFESDGGAYRRLPAPGFTQPMERVKKLSAAKYPGAYPQTPRPPASPDGNGD